MIKLGILFGGKSGEHDVSILSASSVTGAVDRLKYELVPIGINRSGEWFLIETDDMAEITSLDDPRVKTLIPTDAANAGNGATKINPGMLPELIDFALPILHGPNGEDGRMQGLLEILDIPYGGCGVAASAIAMDKIFTREVWIRAGLPMCPHYALLEASFREDEAKIIGEIENALMYPMFVKPANLGSSVGISKAKNREELIQAINSAAAYDGRIIVEQGVDCREVETGVIGNEEVEVAVVGEIKPKTEFYDFESKYRDNTTELVLPAELPAETSEKIRMLAEKAYRALDAAGFARVDFFVEKTTGEIYLNEINTIPGFTRYSMFPLLWAKAGISYGELIERIINLGYERYHAKNSRAID